MNLNPPILLTLSRIALLPVLVLCFYLLDEDKRIVVSLLFILISLTDWLDGYLARRMQLTSKFGAFLDPVADKIAVCVALALLIEEHHSWVITIPAIVIIGREITISALREWMADVGKRAKVAVSMVGKIKTTAQMLAIIFLLYKNNLFTLPMEFIGIILLYIAAALTIWSMLLYGKHAWLVFREEELN